MRRPLAPQERQLGEHSRVVLLLTYGIEDYGFTRRTAVATPADRSGMGRAAVPAEMERSGSFMVIEILVFASADDPVEKHHPASPLGLLQGHPEGSVAGRLAAARTSAGEIKVFQEGDEVMLTAGRAGGNRKMGVPFLPVAGFDLVLGGKPELRPRFALGEGHDGAADPADKAMHDRPNERSSLPPCRRAEGEPGQDLGLGDGSADLLFQHLRQFIKRPRRGQRLAQLKEQLVSRQGFVEDLRPFPRGQSGGGQGAIDGADRLPVPLFILHSLHAFVEQVPGVFHGSGA